jgi:hypothetical protein
LENKAYMHIRILIIKIIKLSLVKDKLDFGKYLSEYKELIITKLYDLYKQTFLSMVFAKHLKKKQ